jgi:hypothetical protein
MIVEVLGLGIGGFRGGGATIRKYQPMSYKQLEIRTRYLFNEIVKASLLRSGDVPLNN